MKRLVELPVDVRDVGDVGDVGDGNVGAAGDGSGAGGVGNGARRTVRVEIEQVEDGLADASRSGRLAARAARSLGELVAGVRPVAESFVEGFGGMEHAPDEIGVEFGLSLSAQADLVVSATAAAANFKVTLTWRKPAPEGLPAQPDAAAAAPDRAVSAAGESPAAPDRAASAPEGSPAAPDGDPASEPAGQGS